MLVDPARAFAQELGDLLGCEYIHVSPSAKPFLQTEPEVAEARDKEQAD